MTRASSLAAFALVVLVTATPRDAAAYSVLAHEAMIDASWNAVIVPALKQRFPQASADDLRAARAYAYGGSLIQDLGYYPFGSHFFSNLVHYVRSGDFVEALIGDASDVNGYAFALGALAHYTSDNAGHPIAVNRVVSLTYPKLGEKYGPQVLYADSPARHIMVEFSFDVTEVGRGTFKADAYQRLIGFEVAVPLLERAFRDTYGLELTDVFGDADLAIGTYRHAASELIPQITRAAWKEKREDILQANPGLAEKDVVYTMTRAQYEQAFGTTYRKPGLLARFVVTVFKILPKFGPFKPLAFQPLTPSTEQMFLDSFARARARYAEWVAADRRHALTLRDTDLDTGETALRGNNPLADATYDDLLKRVAGGKPVALTPALRRVITEHYASAREGTRARPVTPREQKKLSRYLAVLATR
jgi:hypothetical protein